MMFKVRTVCSETGLARELYDLCPECHKDFIKQFVGFCKSKSGEVGK